MHIKFTNNSSAECYQKPKKREARERYQSLSEEEEEKTRYNGHEQYKTLPEHEKQRSVEYRRSHLKIRKSVLQ